MTFTSRTTASLSADSSVAGPSIRTTGMAFDPVGGNHIGLNLPEIGTPLEAR